MEQAGLETDLRSNPTLTKFKDVPSLAKSYVELQGALGKDRIALPGKDAKPEEWDAVYAKLGRPETVAGYELAEWKPPEGLPWDPNVTERMVERMHAHRLTKEQAHGVLNDYAQVYSEIWGEHLSNLEHVNEQTATELQSEWGAAFPVKMEAAKRAAIAFAGPSGEQGNLFDQMTLEDGRKLGDHPDVIRMFAKIGELIAEDGSAGPGARRTTRTPDEARRELDAMVSDKNQFAILNDAMHPEHKALQARRQDLLRLIHGVE